MGYRYTEFLKMFGYGFGAAALFAAEIFLIWSFMGAI